MTWTAFVALVRKDLKIFFNDRRAVIVSFVVPVVLASFMGFVTAGGKKSGHAGKISVLLVDHDQSSVSEALIKGLSADALVEAKTASLDESRELVGNGKVPLAIVIPAHFAELATQAFFRSEGKPEIEILSDPSHGTEVGVVRGVLTQHVMEAVSATVFSAQSGPEVIERARKDLNESRISESDRAKYNAMFASILDVMRSGASASGQALPKAGLSLPFSTRTVPLTNKTGDDYNAYAHTFAGMGVQFVLLAAVEGGLALLNERQRGIWGRFRAAPLGRRTLLAARVISSALCALLSLLVVFGFGALVFGIRLSGSFPGFLLVCMAVSLMAGSLGLLVAALGKTPQAARGISILVILVMVMLGGAWFPTFLFPPAVQKLTLLMPTRWAVDGLELMSWRGLGIAHAALPCAALCGFALAFSAIAFARFRWERTGP